MVVILSVVMLAFAGIAAADINVGVLDMQKLLKNAPQVKAVQAQLKQQFSSQEGKLKAQQKQLQNDVQNYEKNSAVMKAKDKTALEKKITSEQHDFQKQQGDFRNAVIAAQNKAMQKVFVQVKKIVDGVASQQKLNLIVTKSSVVYNDADMDITAQVLKAMK